jgi:membrane protease YdiL (CAAX protease family)
MNSMHLIDFPAVLISVMLILLLFVLGEALRALSVGELFTARRPRRRLKFDPFVLLAALVLFLSFAAGAILLAELQGAASASGRMTMALHMMTVGNLVVVAILIPLLRVTGKNRLADYGITWEGWLDELHYGAVGFLASLPPVIAVLLIMMPWRGPETEHPFLKLLSQTHSDGLLIEVTFAAAVSAPLMEELVFRVVLQGLLETVIHPMAALLIPAVLFASVHGADGIPLFPLAVILGIVYRIRRSYVAVVTVHSLFNMTFLILKLWSRLAM